MASILNKSGRIKSLALGEAAMESINAQALEPLEQSQVFAFSVIACDNEVDRTFERFDDKALDEMAALYVGKTVIKDHVRKSDNQLARVFGARVEEMDSETSYGSRLKTLVLDCYMLDCAENAQAIADIKAGIKREVSVSFMPTSVTCGICGVDNTSNYCRHFAGNEYDGKVCVFTLSDIEDVYELSFVAVPAQRNAGTKKDYMPDGDEGAAEERAKEAAACEGASAEDVETRLREAQAVMAMEQLS